MAGVHPSTRMNLTVGVVSLRRGCLHVRSHLRRPDERIPTTPNVQLPPSISSLPTSDVDGPLSGFRQVDCSLRLRADDAFSSYREDDIRSVDAWRIQQSCQASRRDTLHFSPFQRLRAYCRVLDRLFRRSPVPALKSDQPNRRPTSCKSCRGTQDQHVVLIGSLLASHLSGPWHVIFRTGGVWLRHRQFPARELPRGHPASSRRAPQQGYLRVRHLLYPRFKFHVRCITRHGLLKAWWSLANFARHPTIRAPTSLNYCQHPHQ